ncbi:CD48 antigen-like isoform X3 [Castor canadensis]|uniref:CD48 antigen-like isoform X3 n=1 Tax=Castor canadensis TaxID=51338 RepID=A0A8B7UNZ3_CASCN
MMGSCSEDPNYYWISRLLGVITFLSIYRSLAKSSGAHDSVVKDPGTTIHLKGIRGGSVLFHVTKETAEADVQEITWSFGPGSDYSIMLKMHRGSETPDWVSLQDKYKQRVHVPNMTSLRIENLILQDSGPYKAQITLTNGKGSDQFFHLNIYEPVPPPQIQNNSISITPDWCNVTLECNVTGTSEHLNVTWKSKDLPRELEQRGTPGPAPNPWTLTVRLPHSHLHASLTCVVSNYVDQKNATLELGNICAQGAGLQEDQRVNEDSIHYAQLMEQESQEAKNKGTGEQHLEEEGPVTTVYSEICNQGQAMMII